MRLKIKTDEIEMELDAPEEDFSHSLSYEEMEDRVKAIITNCAEQTAVIIKQRQETLKTI